MPVWSASPLHASCGWWLTVAVFLMGLAGQVLSGSAASASPKISSQGPLLWKKKKQRRNQDPDQVRAQLRWPSWRGFGSCCRGRLPGVSCLPPCLLAEGRLFWSSPSPGFEAKQRRSLPGDRWAVFVNPVTLLAEGRPSLAMALSVRIFNLLPWRMCCLCLEAMAWAYGNLAVPSGFVPGAGEVDPERRQGPDRVLAFQFEVLFVKIQGPVCNLSVVLGPVVRCCVILMQRQGPSGPFSCSKKKS